MQFFSEPVYFKPQVVYTKKEKSMQYSTKWLNHWSLPQHIYQ